PQADTDAIGSRLFGMGFAQVVRRLNHRHGASMITVSVPPPGDPMALFRRSSQLPDATQALPGRATPVVQAGLHAVLGTPLAGPFPPGVRSVLFGMGCFWGAERLFWR